MLASRMRSPILAMNPPTKLLLITYSVVIDPWENCVRNSSRFVFCFTFKFAADSTVILVIWLFKSTSWWKWSIIDFKVCTIFLFDNKCIKLKVSVLIDLSNSFLMTFVFTFIAWFLSYVLIKDKKHLSPMNRQLARLGNKFPEQKRDAQGRFIEKQMDLKLWQYYEMRILFTYI